MNYFFVLEITQSGQGIFIFQHKYATHILQRFRIDKCTPKETHIDLGSKLIKNNEGIEVNATRPDLMHAVFEV